MFQPSKSKDKELQLRSKQSERLSESVHILDHDPSMALYRLQEHVCKTLPVLVSRKYQMLHLNSNLQGACFDLDNAIQAVEQMQQSPAFDSIQEKLKRSIYLKQQIEDQKIKKKLVFYKSNIFLVLHKIQTPQQNLQQKN